MGSRPTHNTNRFRTAHIVKYILWEWVHCQHCITAKLSSNPAENSKVNVKSYVIARNDMVKVHIGYITIVYALHIHSLSVLRLDSSAALQFWNWANWKRDEIKQQTGNKLTNNHTCAHHNHIIPFWKSFSLSLSLRLFLPWLSFVSFSSWFIWDFVSVLLTYNFTFFACSCFLFFVVFKNFCVNFDVDGMWYGLNLFSTF